MRCRTLCFSFLVTVCQAELKWTLVARVLKGRFGKVPVYTMHGVIGLEVPQIIRLNVYTF